MARWQVSPMMNHRAPHKINVSAFQKTHCFDMAALCKLVEFWFCASSQGPFYSICSRCSTLYVLTVSCKRVCRWWHIGGIATLNTCKRQCQKVRPRTVSAHTVRLSVIAADHHTVFDTVSLICSHGCIQKVTKIHVKGTLVITA